MYVALFICLWIGFLYNAKFGSHSFQFFFFRIRNGLRLFFCTTHPLTAFALIKFYILSILVLCSSILSSHIFAVHLYIFWELLKYKYMYNFNFYYRRGIQIDWTKVWYICLSLTFYSFVDRINNNKLKQ